MNRQTATERPDGTSRRSGRSAPRRHRSRLAWRIGSVTVGVVLLAGVIAALLGLGLVRSAAQTQARAALARQADVAADVIDRTTANNPGGNGAAIANAVTRVQDVPAARVSGKGVVTGNKQAVRAVTAQDIADLRAGRSVSTKVTIDDRTILVEGRPLAAGGGIVLTRAATDAVGPVLGLLNRQVIALAVGIVAAALAGVLLARWVAAPLRRVADAARRLSEGGRDVRIPPEGPAEVAQVADSVNALADALAISESRERDFLLSVTHELRTPLTAVKGFAEAVADGVATGGAARQAGTVILAESTRLEHLIGDLLDLARLGANDFSITPVPVNLTAVMDAAATVWRSRCAEVGVEFTASLPADPLVLSTDAARVRQIVDGLIENALRVTPAGRGIMLSLRADGSPAGGHATGRALESGAAVVMSQATGHGAAIEVADGGPGLTADDRAVAFQRSALYERYRGVRPVGTGLGLALVYALATRLGGSASVAEAPGGGALFTIRLPATDPSGIGRRPEARYSRIG
jgi:two-component system sensor histidine kinase BaeS